MKNHVINVTNWKQVLSSANMDPAVGIRIAPLGNYSSIRKYKRPTLNFSFRMSCFSFITGQSYHYRFSVTGEYFMTKTRHIDAKCLGLQG